MGKDYGTRLTKALTLSELLTSCLDCFASRTNNNNWAPAFMISQQFRLLAALPLLTGCGGTGTQEPIQVAPSDFDALLAYSNTQFLALERIEYSDLQSVPANGSATYAGAIEARTDALSDGELAFLANLDLGIVFSSTSPVTWAQTSAIFLADGTPLKGTLSLTDSEFDRDGNPLVDHTFSIGLTGTVAIPDLPDVALSLQLEGDFFGEDKSHIAGNVVGRSQQGTATGGLVGRFVVSD